MSTSIKLDAVQRKLEALMDKNVDWITAKHTYIPYLGKDYSESQLIDWLKPCIDTLHAAQSLTVKEVEERIESIKKTLCSDCLKQSRFTFKSDWKPCVKDYDAFRVIMLLRFSLNGE